MEDKITTLNRITALYSMLEEAESDAAGLTSAFAICDVADHHLDAFDQVLNTLSMGLSNISAAVCSLMEEVAVAHDQAKHEYMAELSHCDPKCPAVQRAIKLLTIERLEKELLDEKVNGNAVDAEQGPEKVL